MDRQRVTFAVLVTVLGTAYALQLGVLGSGVTVVALVATAIGLLALAAGSAALPGQTLGAIVCAAMCLSEKSTTRSRKTLSPGMKLFA